MEVAVCVWEGISLGGRRDIHVFPHAHVYRYHILDYYVCPFVCAISNYFLIQYNVRTHRRLSSAPSNSVHGMARLMIGLKSHRGNRLGCFRKMGRSS